MKYRHIKTNRIVQPHIQKNYYYLASESNLIPSWIIENSNDWEKFEIPYFTTDDEVEIYEGDDTYSVSENNFSLFKNIHSIEYKNDYRLTGFKYFKSKEFALKYIDENEKKFSKKDIQEAIDETIKQHQFNFIFETLKQKLGI